MIGIEWETVTALVSDQGTLTLNAFPGLILDPHKCSATKPLRTPKDPIPQGDGEIIHPRWQNGYEVTLVARAMQSSDTCAAGEESRLLGEALAKHLYATLRDNSGRLFWTPSNYADQRILDEARWFTPVVQQMIEGGIIEYTWGLDSPFPYSIDYTQTVQSVTTAGTVTNNGNVDFYPVIKVNGPATSWAVTNGTVSEGIVYDGTRPGAVAIGGGSYAEIDCFKNTIFLNGSGADLSAGLDPTLSNFFRIAPGANTIGTTGVTADFLMNNAWS